VGSLYELKTVPVREELWREDIVVGTVNIDYTCKVVIKKPLDYPTLYLIHYFIQLENFYIVETGESSSSEPFELLIPVYTTEEDGGKSIWSNIETISFVDFKELCLNNGLLLLSLFGGAKDNLSKPVGKA